MIVQIKNQLLAARSRQKSYTDVRRKPLEFEVGDRVMLKVSPWKGVIRFGKRGKLSPRYIGPFKILSRIGPVAYKLDLTQEIHGIHNTFHVSNLKKCLADEELVIPLDEVKIDDKLHFTEEPVEIMDREVLEDFKDDHDLYVFSKLKYVGIMAVQLPIAYHGRASSIVVSGTDIIRPSCGDGTQIVIEEDWHHAQVDLAVAYMYKREVVVSDVIAGKPSKFDRVFPFDKMRKIG
uniref:Putative reverse transcriptase domain-containing protein n=1 Tax=Tanacetum cinerariifolium TaxID=118510 RepID=A0A699I379_TANCI|nr:putative reverse transcriptase domain-containing protein [Tanacetum cinerariifolium]